LKVGRSVEKRWLFFISVCWWHFCILSRGCSFFNLNVAKFFLIWINIKEHKVFRLAVELGCKMESLTLNSLGLPLGGKHWFLAFWLSGMSTKLEVRLLNGRICFFPKVAGVFFLDKLNALPSSNGCLSNLISISCGYCFNCL